MEVGRPGRKGCGRRRIEIKKIENQMKRHVAFSKRKKGLLSKADRLSRLSGEDIGIVIISEKGRVYTSDNADAVIHRYRSMVKDDNTVGRDKERLEARCRPGASSTAPKWCRPHNLHKDKAAADAVTRQRIVEEGDYHNEKEMGTPRLETLALLCKLESSITCLDDAGFVSHCTPSKTFSDDDGVVTHSHKSSVSKNW
ncbi:hypothetical protein HRI_000289500 [Hibiscus trionum]|uniref:MADS-box domain-containing protein n=1 Tax=Hibiscus trionum TaxID=183268 RepID=A0A9W7GV65_HIBTR|nr:hypothetical protein HRI_000289500 [Hibiscus trionum]